MKPVITAKNLTKAYSDINILDKVDFKIGNNTKIGLVGRNGCGKTTLFKSIAGVEEPTSGSIEIQDEIIGYIPQEFSFPNKLIGEYFEELLENDWEFYKVEALAMQLKFDEFDIYQDVTTLSEGQKMKIKLIEVLLKEPTTLLIDEPTNHLDIEGIMWFENYIKHLNVSVVMISHDRSFLNHTVDEIWEIENATLHRFVGDYDNYREEKLKLINKWDEEYKRFLRKKNQLEQLLENVRKIKGGKERGRAVSAAKKRIEREVEAKEVTKYETKSMKKVDFETDVRQSKLVLRFEDATKKYGEKLVFEDLSFEVRGQQKVWLFGPNGAGKSTLVKIIMGEEEINSGEVKLGNNIRVGYFAQKQSKLDFNKSVYDQFIAETGCDRGKAYGVLKKFLFDGDAIKKKVSQLSPGERARFAFAIFAYEDYDFLILDEPTNHLDIETKEAIEQSLLEFKGTLLLVSHDRYFVESIGVDKILNLRENALTQY